MSRPEIIVVEGGGGGGGGDRAKHPSSGLVELEEEQEGVEFTCSVRHGKSLRYSIQFDPTRFDSVRRVARTFPTDACEQD